MIEKGGGFKNIVCKAAYRKWGSGFHLRNCSQGGNWRNLDFMGGRGMMVKDVTKFHKHHLRGMLECVCVCMCSGFRTGF